MAVLGTWASGYFILVANSWMQDPVGYKIVDGEAQLTSVWQLLSNDWALWAFGHTIFAGLTAGSAVVFGVCCWHFARGKNTEVFKPAAKVALIVLVPVSAFNLWFGSNFGIVTTQLQPMKIAATEALWDTEQPASFSLFQIGGFTTSDQTPSFSIEVPRLLSFLATGSFNGQVVGINENQTAEEQQYGRGQNYIPPVEAVYWSMRIMAYLGTLVFLVAAVGAFLFWRGKLERARWYLWTAVVAIAFPFMAALAGWVLTEVGRQPWIVQGLLRTDQANSPSVGTAWIATSLGIFIGLYLVLGILDFVLMRRYAKPDKPPTRENLPEAAVTY
jgi:cytochrome d ubiquinol oxidase subunit I